MHFARGVAEGRPFLVPPIFWLEIVNVLARRYRYPPAAIVEAVYELEQAGLTTAELGRPGTLATIDAVGRSGLTAYDAAYLVLAESSDARLLTADATQAAAAGARALLVTAADGVAEEQPFHRADPPWPAWKGAVAYLSELRAELILAGPRDA
jgi:predicted nucleic acid-binding protein